jgi:hypothetical protein
MISVVLLKIVDKRSYPSVIQELIQLDQLNCESVDSYICTVFKLVDVFAGSEYRSVIAKLWPLASRIDDFQFILNDLHHADEFYMFLSNKVQKMPFEHILPLYKDMIHRNYRYIHKFCLSICAKMVNCRISLENSAILIQLNELLFSSNKKRQNSPIFLDWMTFLKTCRNVQFQQQGVEFCDRMKNLIDPIPFDNDMSFLYEYAGNYTWKDVKIATPEKYVFRKTDKLILRHPTKVESSLDDDDTVLELKNVKTVWGGDLEGDSPLTPKLEKSDVQEGTIDIGTVSPSIESNSSLSPEHIFLDSNHKRIEEWMEHSSTVTPSPMISTPDLSISFCYWKTDLAIMIKLVTRASTPQKVVIEHNQPFLVHGDSVIDSKTIFLSSHTKDVFIEIFYSNDDPLQDIEFHMSETVSSIPICVVDLLVPTFLSISTFESLAAQQKFDDRLIINTNDLSASTIDLQRFGLMRILDRDGETFGCARIMNLKEYLLINVKNTPFGISIWLKSNYTHILKAILKEINKIYS